MPVEIYTIIHIYTYTCVCVCVFICTYVCIRTHIHSDPILMYVCMHTHVHTLRPHTYVRIYAYTRTCIQTPYLCTYIQSDPILMYVYMHTHVHTIRPHTYLRIYAYTRTYNQTPYLVTGFLTYPLISVVLYIKASIVGCHVAWGEERSSFMQLYLVVCCQSVREVYLKVIVWWKIIKKSSRHCVQELCGFSLVWLPRWYLLTYGVLAFPSK
jgi:hypothetical protein